MEKRVNVVIYKSTQLKYFEMLYNLCTVAMILGTEI